MTGSNITQHRASIGSFYPKAVHPRHKFQLTYDLTLPAIILVLWGRKYIHLSILAFLTSCFSKHKNTTIQTYKSNHDADLAPKQNLSPQSMICCKTTLILSIIIFLTTTLILLSGNVELNPGPDPTLLTKHISIIHSNISSLRNKIDFLNLEAKAQDIDIITLSETWLTDDIKNDSLLLTGYRPPIRRDRPGGWGGVAIYVKDNLICRERPDLAIPDLDAVWIETKIDQETILVCSMYRPPSARVSYWNLIEESIKKAYNNPHRFFILGDLNSDVMKNPPPHRHLTNIINQYHLHQLVNEYTRIKDGSSSCIDLILTSSTDLVTRVSVLPPIRSDHMVPLLELKSNTRAQPFYKKTILNYSKLRTETFKDKLAEVDLLNIVQNFPVNDSALLFTENFMNIARSCMPIKVVKIRENSPKWLNNYLLILREQKNHIHQVAKRLDTDELWEDFRKFRNFYTDEIRKRKDSHIKELDDHISNRENFNTKRWWKLVNDFLKNKGVNNIEIPPLEEGNETIYDTKKKATCFNNYFKSQSQVLNEDDPLPIIPLQDSTLMSINLTVDDVITSIKELEPNKAVGPDMIHNSLLITACPIIAQPLTLLFNRSLAEGVFPQIWKTAHVTPIYKLKGERSSCSNYRPISLLSCVGKLFEKCVQKYVLEHLRSNEIITSSQSGFTQGDSTVYQLLNIYDDFCSALDRHNITQAIFFDISKAFDRVWHRGLLCKLHAAGIRGTLNCWFKDYLSNRQQAVVIQGCRSEYLPVTAGVPQGSVLGPLLFLVYINDINSDIESTSKLFADDTSIYVSLNDNNVRGDILNSDLEKIKAWAFKWKVSFNCQKTELLNICKPNANISNQLVFDGSLLIASESHKHLGLYIKKIANEIHTLIVF